MLDEAGTTIYGPVKVPGFQRAAFSAKEEYLVLTGLGGTQVRAVADGGLVWQDAKPIYIAGGGCLKCSADGASFYLITLERDENDDPTIAMLTQRSFVSSTPLLVKTLSETQTGGWAYAPIDILVEDPLTVTVVTKTGRISIPR